MSGSTLSVVMPNFNDARYLSGALEAIAGQSFPPREIVVVDDASTDDSVEVIRSFMRRYSFIRMIQNDRNRGAIDAVNRGLQAVTGDYVTLPAADDRVLPGCFEKSMALLRRYPEAGLCSGLSLLIDEEGRSSGVFPSPLISRSPCYLPPEKVVSTYLRFGMWVMVQSTIYKRSAIMEAGGYVPDFGETADTFLFHVIAARYGACFIPQPLGAWRRSAARSRAKAERDRVTFENTFPLVERLENRLESPQYRPLFPREYIDALKRRSRFVMIHELARRGQYAEIAALAPTLPAPTWLDRLYFMGARRGLGAWLTKPYIFWRQLPRDRRRIAWRKLLEILGRGDEP